MTPTLSSRRGGFRMDSSGIGSVKYGEYTAREGWRDPGYESPTTRFHAWMGLFLSRNRPGRERAFARASAVRLTDRPPSWPCPLREEGELSHVAKKQKIVRYLADGDS